jgi:hypothetical protein
MLIAEARVETERSSRYLVQFCRHMDKTGGAPADAGRRDQLTVTWAAPWSAGEGDSQDTRRRLSDTRGPHMAVMNEDPDDHARQEGHAHD